MKLKASLEGRKAMFGRFFVYPWVIGFVVFMLLPLIESLVFAFSDVNVTQTGYVVEYLGWDHFDRAWNVDMATKKILTDSLINMAVQVPLIILFSLFIAVLLNQKFRGRTFARAMFFLPVIITSGALLSAISLDVSVFTSQTSSSSSSSLPMISTFNFGAMLRDLMPIQQLEGFITYIIDLMSRIYQIIWASGVQIILFLAGLQAIPAHMYEAASVEGASGWEAFWKITFPLISPIILINTVYSVIDNFTSPFDPMLMKIREVAFVNINFGYASALSWLYFIFIFVVVLAVLGVISRYTFYINE